jgi:hypothetical protein
MVGKFLYCALFSAGTALAQGGFSVELEGGPFWTSRNEVRIPGDTGTKFLFTDLIGKGPEPWFRVYLNWDINEKHRLGGLLAPLEASRVGTLSQPVNFTGRVFAPGVPTEAIFEFNTWRLGYRYTFFNSQKWLLRVGATAFVRDARVELRQRDTTGVKTDVGVVPLAAFSGRYNFTPRTHLLFDFEGLAAPQGRALDGAVKLAYDLTDHLRIGIGYRTLEGGVDNDEVFNFTWIHYAMGSIEYRF